MCGFPIYMPFHKEIHIKDEIRIYISQCFLLSCPFSLVFLLLVFIGIVNTGTQWESFSTWVGIFKRKKVRTTKKKKQVSRENAWTMLSITLSKMLEEKRTNNANEKRWEKKGKKNNEVAMKTGGKAGFYGLRRIQHFLHLILILCYSVKVDNRFQHEYWCNWGPNHPERLELDIYDDSRG